MTGERRALAWLAHPFSVAAVVLLVLNDHVLKARFPGWATGNLSDVAGLVFAPALLAVALSFLVRQRALAPIALVTTGGLFTIVKTSEPAAGVASAAWSVVNGPSTVLADVTDLLALPALALSWWVWRRTAGTRVVLSESTWPSFGRSGAIPALAVLGMLLALVGFWFWLFGLVSRPLGAAVTVPVLAGGGVTALVTFLVGYAGTADWTAVVVGAVGVAGTAALGWWLGRFSLRARRSPQGSMPAAS